MQNLPRETGWHLRGIRRIGVGFEDVEVVQQCVSFFLPFSSVNFASRVDWFCCFVFVVFSASLSLSLGILTITTTTLQLPVNRPTNTSILGNLQIEKVASFCGLQLTRVPRVKDIEHEVVVD